MAQINAFALVLPCMYEYLEHRMIIFHNENIAGILVSIVQPDAYSSCQASTSAC